MDNETWNAISMAVGILGGVYGVAKHLGKGRLLRVLEAVIVGVNEATTAIEQAIAIHGDNPDDLKTALEKAAPKRQTRRASMVLGVAKDLHRQVKRVEAIQ